MRARQEGVGRPRVVGGGSPRVGVRRLGRGGVRARLGAKKGGAGGG